MFASMAAAYPTAAATARKKNTLGLELTDRDAAISWKDNQHTTGLCKEMVRVITCTHMADDTPVPKSGCFHKLAVLFVVFALAGIGAAMFFASQPQDLSDIGGYGVVAEDPERGRDVGAELRASVERGHEVRLTEAEINHWLARTLRTRQGGLLEEHVALKGVWVRLEDGVAEVVMEREVAGWPVTLSMFVSIEQTESDSGLRTALNFHGGRYHEMLPRPPRGGRFGQLVVPQGFLKLVLPAYRSLAEVFAAELEDGFNRMARIRIEENRLVLDPRGPEIEIQLGF